MTEDIKYEDLSITELIDILEHKLDHPLDKRKKKEYLLYKEDCDELIDIINTRSNLKMYNKLK